MYQTDSLKLLKSALLAKNLLPSKRLILGSTLAGILFVLVASAILAVNWTYQYIDIVARLNHQEPAQLVAEVVTAINQSQPQSQPVSILLLGLDQLDERSPESLLTDTLILVNFNPRRNQVKVVSLPRDLWLAEYETKINSIYYYGHQQTEVDPQTYTKSIIAEVTGQEVDYLLPLSMNGLEDLIDSLGGVEIDVATGFVDNEFPKPDVPPDAPEDQLYKTVRFEPGSQLMSGSRALEYIRSRHSGDLETGTDISRSERQKQLVAALVAKLTKKETLINPQIVGSIYNWYQTYIQPYGIDLTTIFGWLKSLSGMPEIISVSIPATLSGDPEEILYNPRDHSHNLWVFAPRDDSWQELHQFLESELE